MASPSPSRIEPLLEVPMERVAASVQRLDPATRALLDLSVRRRVRDDAMAPVLRTDPFHLAWRRARALERIADEIGSDGRPAELADVRAALEALPREAWGLPGLGAPALPPPRTDDAPVPPWQHALAEDEAIRTAQEARDELERALAELTAPRAGSGTGTALVPTTSTALDTPAEPRTGRFAATAERLDAFAAESPALGLAVRQFGRALAAKAVRLVVWRRRAPRASG
jgi:hypothetical protein